MSNAVPRSINPPEHCEECGWHAASIVAENAATAVSDLGPRYQEAFIPLLRSDAKNALRRRPSASSWSALEYAAHVRDVIALWSWALHKLLTEDRPVLPRPDPSIADEGAAAGGYNTLDPSITVNQLFANANRMARKIATISADQWNEVIIFGDEEMTAIAVVRKVAHEGEHHLLDIRRSLHAARSA